MFEDRWYQVEAEQSAFDYFESHRGIPGNPLIALPTGTGKSVVIARFCKRALSMYPRTRIMMLTHVKELIQQNANKLLRVWPTAPLGVVSAGLNRRETMMPITFGGVATVKNMVENFGYIDILIIDEAHLLNPSAETMYQYVIAQLLKRNPYLRVMGLTATPFRLKQGMLTDDGIFTDVCYNGTTRDMFGRMIAEGYISPPISKRTETFIDISNVGMLGNEFKPGELEAASDIQEITYGAVKETVQFGMNRASWLMFGAGINHAEHIAEMQRGFGINAAAVHSGLSGKENDRRLKDFKEGKLRSIVNMGKLTTGFDHPPIDLIGMLRATNSPGLWVQMLGRGTRPYDPSNPGDEVNPHVFNMLKRNCLVLDFARNTPRLGPIDDPVLPRKPGKGGGGDAPIRICENCGAYNHASVRVCVNCYYEFPVSTKIFHTAGSEDLLSGPAPVVNRFEVKLVMYQPHEKKDGEGKLLSPPMIKVTYVCGFQAFSEYIQLESPTTFVRKRARDWWRQRHTEEPPMFTYEALSRTSELRKPTFIHVHTNKQHPEILRYEF